jgi:hypothetical protein
MKLKKITQLLKATVHFAPDGRQIDVENCSASDLMSDVLAFIPGGGSTLLITSLLTLQVIRTATLMDISIVVFTRGKVPTEKIIDAAKRNDIAILTTDLTKYTACGLLYTAGLKSIDGYVFKGED